MTRCGPAAPRPRPARCRPSGPARDRPSRAVPTTVPLGRRGHDAGGRPAGSRAAFDEPAARGRPDSADGPARPARPSRGAAKGAARGRRRPSDATAATVPTGTSSSRRRSTSVLSTGCRSSRRSSLTGSGAAAARWAAGPGLTVRPPRLLPRRPPTMRRPSPRSPGRRHPTVAGKWRPPSARRRPAAPPRPGCPSECHRRTWYRARRARKPAAPAPPRSAAATRERFASFQRGSREGRAAAVGDDNGSDREDGS